MTMTAFLASEWKIALGCTEPAAVAWAAALAAAQGEGRILQVTLSCDPRTYKNCFAVGIPNAQGATGICWALALGANLPDGNLELRCFEAITASLLAEAAALLEAKGVRVDVDTAQTGLMIDVTVLRERGEGRAVLQREHAHLARLERDGLLVGGAATEAKPEAEAPLRQDVAQRPIHELMAWAATLTGEDRARLREGADLNLAIARHGLAKLPAGFTEEATAGNQLPAQLVSAGVYARMSGLSHPVMTLAGSGNKGITLAVPLYQWGRVAGVAEARLEEALAFGCLMTSAATWHLGTLSAICGAANAAGIGLASALVYLEGGTPSQVGLAVSTMVGNLAGMICDGAKIGCAMKTMTGVEAAFRAASLARRGLGIPATDGIVGEDGASSLVNLGRLAQVGMQGVDTEILRIMQEKLNHA